MKNKMKNKIKITILMLFLLAPVICFAEETGKSVEPLKEAYIQYRQVGWQTYEFYVLTNGTETTNLTYEWVVNDIETFNTEKLRYFFPIGTQAVKVRVADSSGNSRSDAVQLDIRFWSLKNNWFWWALYLVIILMIFYYWALKIYYLLNRRRINRQARYFLDLLDEHGWVEKIISHKSKAATRNL
jgi:hypothetical protein